jgi:parallel beta-helix repeat protein
LLKYYDQNQVLYTGTSHASDICPAFESHGIKTLSCLGFTEFPVAIITSPPPQEWSFFTKEDKIVIFGIAYGSVDPFWEYSVEFVPYGTGEGWSSEGITTIGGEVIDSVLAVWDISSIPNGVYTIRLTVVDTAGKSSNATANVQIDRNIHEGWPKKVAYAESPTLGDVNNDSVQDIIANSGKEVHIWSSNGSDVTGWPQLASSDINAPLALGDLNNDGLIEIVGATNNQVYVWYGNGSLFDGNEDGIADWPKLIGFSSGIGTSTPILADLNEDDFLEIIIGGSGESKVYVLDKDGSAFKGWPKETAGMVVTTAAIGDLDKAYPGKEVIVASFGNKVYAWHADGTNVPGWPQEVINSNVRSSPALGDLNNDESLEVVLAAGDTIYVWKSKGEIIWKKQLDTWTTSSASLGDIDNDGNLEVVIPSGENFYIFSSTGELLGKWPLFSHLSSPALGDIDNDEELEAVVGSYEKKLYAFNHDGTAVSEWPKFASDDFSQSPAIGDVDGDGKLEVVAGSFNQYLYVWDLSADYNANKLEWPQFHHDAQHTGLYWLDCNKPYDNIQINKSTTLCPGTYYINDSDNLGVIKIKGDNLKLDCRHAIIIGNGTGRGIYNIGHKNVTIKNCIVNNYTNGIYLYLAMGNFIYSNSALNNDWSGIYLTNSNNSIVNDNIVGGNHHGIGLFFSDKNSISSNNVSLNNNIGIYLKYSAKNTISSNSANTNAYGIDLHESSNYNLIFNNTANYNLYFGFSIDTSDSNTLVNNDANYNYYGLFIENANKNKLEKNNLTYNKYGIRFLPGNKDNKVLKNFVCHSTITDISVKENNFGNKGEKNTCISVSNWEESGKMGCTYSC